MQLTAKLATVIGVMRCYSRPSVYIFIPNWTISSNFVLVEDTIAMFIHGRQKRRRGKLSFDFKNLKLVYFFGHRKNIDVKAISVNAHSSCDMLCTYSKACLHESHQAMVLENP